MVEIPDWLEPKEGLTNAYIKFNGLEAYKDGWKATLMFAFYNENRDHVADFSVHVDPEKGQKVDELVAEGHRRMTNILRQWLQQVDQARQSFEGEIDST
jgi:hypothetical protein